MTEVEPIDRRWVHRIVEAVDEVFSFFLSFFNLPFSFPFDSLDYRRFGSHLDTHWPSSNPLWMSIMQRRIKV
jgi:hypothetical protein